MALLVELPVGLWEALSLSVWLMEPVLLPLAPLVREDVALGVPLLLRLTVLLGVPVGD